MVDINIFKNEKKIKEEQKGRIIALNSTTECVGVGVILWGITFN